MLSHGDEDSLYHALRMPVELSTPPVSPSAWGTDFKGLWAEDDDTTSEGCIQDAYQTHSSEAAPLLQAAVIEQETGQMIPCEAGLSQEGCVPTERVDETEEVVPTARTTPTTAYGGGNVPVWWVDPIQGHGQIGITTLLEQNDTGNAASLLSSPLPSSRAPSKSPPPQSPSMPQTRSSQLKPVSSSPPPPLPLPLPLTAELFDRVLTELSPGTLRAVKACKEIFVTEEMPGKEFIEFLRSIQSQSFTLGVVFAPRVVDPVSEDTGASTSPPKKRKKHSSEDSVDANGLFWCTVKGCKRKVPYQEHTRLVDHMRYRHGPKRFKCSCFQAFADQWDLILSLIHI